MELLIIIPFCILVALPLLLCKKGSLCTKRTNWVLSIWGAVTGIVCYLSLYVIAALTTNLTYTGSGNLFSDDLAWLDSIFDLVAFILPAVFGALAGRNLRSLDIWSVIGRIIKIFVLTFLCVIVLALLSAFINDPVTLFVVIAIIAIAMSFLGGDDGPAAILIFFK